jgi:hypothetical protein
MPGGCLHGDVPEKKGPQHARAGLPQAQVLAGRGPETDESQMALSRREEAVIAHYSRHELGGRILEALKKAERT